MTIAYSQSNFASDATGTATSLACAYTGSTTAGSLLIALVETYTTSVTISSLTGGGNTWSPARHTKAVGATGDGNLFAYYVPSAAGGAVTVTANLSAGDYIGLGILEYTGLSTAVLDVVKDGLLADTGTFQSTRTMTLTASGPTAAASELALLIGSDTHNDAAYTATGWTRRVDLEDGTNSANLAVFDQILTSVITPSGTLTRTELVSGSDGFVGQLLTFQSSGGAPAFRPRPNPLRFQAVTRAATY